LYVLERKAEKKGRKEGLSNQHAGASAAEAGKGAHLYTQYMQQ
jgi:hypothetical protein